MLMYGVAQPSFTNGWTSRSRGRFRRDRRSESAAIATLAILDQSAGRTGVLKSRSGTSIKPLLEIPPTTSFGLGCRLRQRRVVLIYPASRRRTSSNKSSRDIWRVSKPTATRLRMPRTPFNLSPDGRLRARGRTWRKNVWRMRSRRSQEGASSGNFQPPKGSMSTRFSKHRRCIAS